MQNIVLVILLIFALSLIVTVLMQRSEGGGLGIGGGGGGNSGRPPASPVAKFTWILGAGFMASCLALTVISARDSGNTSVLSGAVPIEQAAEQTGDTPLTGNLLPPSAEDAPATPPKAEE